MTELDSEKTHSSSDETLGHLPGGVEVATVDEVHLKHTHLTRVVM